VDEIESEIRALCDLRFTREELDYLRRWRFFKSDFVDLLGLFHLQQRFRERHAAQRLGREIDIAIKGPWLHTILFEVPVLAIVSEVYYRNTVPSPDLAEGRRRLASKIARANAIDTATSASPTTARAGAFRASGRKKCCARSRAT
jgi:nicotinate phosphoribosyltransferase